MASSTVPGRILQIYSLLFHFLLALFLLGSAGLAWSAGNTLDIPILPWEGDTLILCVFFSGLAALLITLFSIGRGIRGVFVGWNVVVLAMLVRGYFFSRYQFPIDGTIWFAAGLSAAALLALLGSVSLLRAPKPARKPQSIFGQRN